MKLQLTGTGVLAVLAVAGVGVGLWYARRTAAGLGASVGELVNDVQQAATQAAANVSSWTANNVTGPFQQGQDYMNGAAPVVSSKAWLYSDYAYTGIDQATGQLVTDGEYYGDAVARRYDAEQRAAGASPAASSINGAAFGIYPSAMGNANTNFGITGDEW